MSFWLTLAQLAAALRPAEYYRTSPKPIRSMTFVHLRRRVHQYRKPEECEGVRHERHDLRDQALLDSKNVQRQGTPCGIAGPAHVSCDRRLQVGVRHNAAEATKPFGAESA